MSNKLPTLKKTWEITPNVVAGTSVSALDSNQKSMWHLKDVLTGFTTYPWTVHSSSDSVNYTGDGGKVIIPMPDASGNNLTGTINGVVGSDIEADTAGNFSTFSMKLDGSTGYVTMGDVLNFDHDSVFSITAWFKSAGITGNDYIVSKISATTRGYGIEVSAAGAVTVRLSNSSSVEIDVSSTTTGLDDDNWHFVAVTYDGGGLAAGINIYVDSVLETPVVNTDALAGNTIITTTEFNISGRDNGTADEWEGNLDDVAIYDKVLTQNEVINLYNKSTNFSQNSMDFDGTADIVYVGDLSIFDFERTDAFSVSCWIKYSVSQGRVLVGKEDGASPFKGWHFGLSSINDAIDFFLSASTVSRLQIKGTTPLNDNLWHHVMATYDGSSSELGISLYVDSVIEENQISQSDLNSSITNSFPLLIGARGTLATPNAPFDGKMDDVAIYDKEVTQSEVVTIYNNGAPSDLKTTGPFVDLVGYWRMGDANQFSDNAILFGGTNEFINGKGLYDFENDRDFSIGGWFKIESTGDQSLISHRQVGSSDPGWELLLLSNKLTFIVNDTSGTLVSVSAGTSDQWIRGNHHFVATWEGTTSNAASNAKIYVDGVSQTLTVNADTLAGSIANDSEFQIGAIDGTSRAIVGSIDDVFVYDDVLTSGEVTTIYNNGTPSDLRLGGMPGNLVGYYLMGDGDTYPDIQNQINTTIFSNTSTTFDGGNDTVLVGDASDYKFAHDDEFSVSFWTKTTRGVAGGDSAIAKRETGGVFRGWEVQINHGSSVPSGLVVNITNTNASNEARALIPASVFINDDAWHHIIFTWDGTSSQDVSNLHIYMDGIDMVLTIIANSLSATIDSSAALHIGSRGGSQSIYKGEIDDVAIYNKALSQGEVTTIYNNGLPNDLKISGPTVNLVGYWLMGDGDTFPTITDHSQGSFSSLCLDFDGSNDSLDMGDPTELKFAHTDVFSASLWAKFTATSGALVGKEGNASPKQGWHLEAGTSGILSVILRNDDSPTNYIQVDSTTTGFNDDKWHHIVFTWNGATTTVAANVTLYVDGSSEGLSTINDDLTATIDSTAVFSVGSIESLGSFFAGRIDDVAIYNKELTSGEVTTIYNNAAPGDLTSIGPTANLVGYWLMGDGATFPTIVDASTNSNNGTMNSMVAGDIVVIGNDGTMTNMLAGDFIDGVKSIDLVMTNMESTDIIPIMSDDSDNNSYGMLVSPTTIIDTPFTGPSDLTLTGPTGNLIGYWLMGENATQPTSIDNWLLPSNIIWATNPTPHSWIVLQHPRRATQFCINCNTGSVDGRVASMYVSFGGNFTGGDETTKPTAVDELEAGIDQDWLGPITTAYDSWIHGWNSDDGYKTRIYIATDEGDGQGGFYLFDDVDSPSPLWEQREVALIAQHKGTAGGSVFDTESWMTVNKDAFSSAEHPNNFLNSLNKVSLLSGPQKDTSDTSHFSKGSIMFNSRSSSETEYMLVGDQLPYKFDTSDKFSISCWLRTTASLNQGLVSKISSSSPRPGYTLEMNSAGEIVWIIAPQRGTPSTQSYELTSSLGYNDGLWHFIMVTWDGNILDDVSGLKLYVDGLLADYILNDIGGPLVSTIDNTEPLLIGGTDLTEGFVGNLTDVAIYDIELTSTEVATIYNNGNFSIAPFSINSIELDGSDDSIDMGDVAELSFEHTDPFSISCWFKYHETQTAIFAGKQEGTAGFKGYSFGVTVTTDLPFIMLSNAAGNRIHMTGASVFNDENWHHAVMTYDGLSRASGTKLYIDSVLQTLTVTEDTLTDSIDNTVAFELGARADGTEDFFNGKLDDVAVYDKELTATEITTIYGSGNPNDLRITGPSADLVGYWRMGDSATFPDILDESTNTNDGYMNNMTSGDIVTDVVFRPIYTQPGEPLDLRIIGPVSNNIGYWLMGDDEGISDVFPEVRNRIASEAIFPNVPDESLNSNDGTQVNMTSDTVVDSAPKSSSVYTRYSTRFDGASKYYDGGDNPAFDFERTDTFSGQAWIKTSGSLFGVIMAKLLSTGNITGWEFAIHATGQIRLILISVIGTNNFLNVNSSTSVNDGAWHHIMFTYDGSSFGSGVEFYIDGVLEVPDVDVDDLTTSIVAGADFSIGTRDAGACCFFNGLMADVALWDKELSLSEVQAIYNLGVPSDLRLLSTGGNLISWWRCGDGDGPLFWFTVPRQLQMSDRVIPTDSITASPIVHPVIPDHSFGKIPGTLVNTETGDITTDTPGGIAGFSVDFDGTNEYMTSPFISMMNRNNQEPFSFSLWIKTTATSGVLVGTFVGNAAQSGYGLDLLGGKPSVRKIISTSTFQDTYTSDTTINDGYWHHVVGTHYKREFNNNDFISKIYIDGIETGFDDGFTVRNLQNQASGATAPMTIGARDGTISAATGFIDGKFSEVALYFTALTAAQVSEIYNSGVPNDLRQLKSSEPFLHGWWRMGHRIGNDLDNISMIVADKVGDSPAEGPFSKKSIEFEGSVSSTERVDIGDVLDKTGSDSFSVSAWVVWNGWVGSLVIIGNLRATGGSGDGWRLGANTGQLLFDFKGTGALRTGVGRGRKFGIISPGEWHHVVMTYNGSFFLPGVKFYINGILEAHDNEIDTFTAGGSSAGDELTIGRTDAADSSPASWGGNLSEISMWDKVLSQSEVNELYNSGVPKDLLVHSAYENLEAWWRMGDGSIYFNGTLTNMEREDLGYGDTPGNPLVYLRPGANMATSDGYVGAFLNERTSGLNELDDLTSELAYPIHPIPLFGDYGHYGHHGFIEDLWWGPSLNAPPTGNTFPSSLTERQFVQVGDIVLPWAGDGTSPLMGGTDIVNDGYDAHLIETEDAPGSTVIPYFQMTGIDTGASTQPTYHSWKVINNPDPTGALAVGPDAPTFGGPLIKIFVSAEWFE